MNTLSLYNFKCFSSLNLNLGRLTVLAGENGAGKSTVIQSLLLLRRIYDRQKNSERDLQIKHYVDLNNEYYCFGGVGNIQCQSSLSNEIGISFSDDFGNIINAVLNSNDDYHLGLKIDAFVCNGETPINKKEFYYLNAERLGPRLVQGIKHLSYLNVGIKGEYTGQILGDTDYSFGFKVIEERLFSGKSNSRLLTQVNAWLGDILPNVEVEANYSRETLSSQIRIKNSYSKKNAVLSTNIGFGISYLLPIIVQCLIAEPKSLLIIENPEAHLHPAAQSKLGYFLSKIANSGVNLLVETHSEHVIHGMQLSVIDKTIDADLININFFSNLNEEQPTVKEIKLNDSAELSNWPKGFFDQSQIDLRKLFLMRNGS